jgi:hypothetical protein
MEKIEASLVPVHCGGGLAQIEEGKKSKLEAMQDQGVELIDWFACSAWNASVVLA